MTEQERWARVGQALERQKDSLQLGRHGLPNIHICKTINPADGWCVIILADGVQDRERPTLLAALEAGLGLTGEEPTDEAAR